MAIRKAWTHSTPCTVERQALPSLKRRERAVINEVAAHASRWHGFSGMSDDHARPVGAARQVAATRRTFEVDDAVDAEDPLPGWSSRRRPVPASASTRSTRTSWRTG
ncbi:hypothetical protein ACIRG5_17480 [Lentzea sp. NPDC102401]|uniref:hypothetical protein n=1 Tax=Lentzea sp. NPDC102401 TaxID=3364128 RepID=UPI003826154F